jgi:hypothetical protein
MLNGDHLSREKTGAGYHYSGLPRSPQAIPEPPAASTNFPGKKQENECEISEVEVSQ